MESEGAPAFAGAVGRRAERPPHARRHHSPRLVSTWASALHRDRCRRRGPSRGLVPQSAVTQNHLDHLGLVTFDEGDAHRRAALQTAKRIRFVHLLDQRRPAFAALPRCGRPGGNPRSGSRRRSSLGPVAPGLVGVPRRAPTLPTTADTGRRGLLPGCTTARERSTCFRPLKTRVVLAVRAADRGAVLRTRPTELPAPPSWSADTLSVWGTSFRPRQSTGHRCHPGRR